MQLGKKSLKIRGGDLGRTLLPGCCISTSTFQVREVSVPLSKELQEAESPPRLHEKVAEYWKAYWHQVAVALKFKEEELQFQRQNKAWLPHVGALCPLFSSFPQPHPPHSLPRCRVFPRASQLIFPPS